VSSFLDLPVGRFLEQVADRAPAPGGGAAAALTGALAAGLVAMAARFSTAQLPDSEEIAAQADALRRRAGELIDEDARAYKAVLDAFALPRDGEHGQRQGRVRDALRGAAEPPAEIAQVAAQVAGLAARVYEAGNPNLRGDAATAGLLAEASARSAARLVEINVTLGGLDHAASERAAQEALHALASAMRIVPRPQGA
jgi:formiminotetrahydrofolate cyclodeaminase